MGIIFDQFFAPERDPAELELANRLLHESTQRIEDALDPGPYLLGERLTAADLFAAPLVATALSPAESPVGVVRFFAEHLNLREGRERTKAWAERVMALDA